MSFLEPTTILPGKLVLNTRILKRRAVDAGRDSSVSFRNARGASVAAVLHKHDAYKLAMRICCPRGLSGGTPRHATTPGHDWAQRNAFIRSSGFLRNVTTYCTVNRAGWSGPGARCVTANRPVAERAMRYDLPSSLSHRPLHAACRMQHACTSCAEEITFILISVLIQFSGTNRLYELYSHAKQGKRIYNAW